MVFDCAFLLYLILAIHLVLAAVGGYFIFMGAGRTLNFMRKSRQAKRPAYKKADRAQPHQIPG